MTAVSRHASAEMVLSMSTAMVSCVVELVVDVSERSWIATGKGSVDAFGTVAALGGTAEPSSSLWHATAHPHVSAVSRAIVPAVPRSDRRVVLRPRSVPEIPQKARAAMRFQMWPSGCDTTRFMNSKAVKIAAPCGADWTKMTPADGGRFCGDCKKVVKNISSMTEKDARKLLRSAGEGELCVRYMHDKLGNVVFGADQPRPDFVPASMLSRAKRAIAYAGLAVASQACSAISDASDKLTSPLQSEPTQDDSHDQNQNHEYNMGGAAYDPSYDSVSSDQDGGADAASPTDQDAGPAAQGDAAADQDAGPSNVPN